MTTPLPSEQPPPTGAAEAPPVADEKLGSKRARARASQWRLVWWAFRRHRLAMIGLVATIAIYFVAVFADTLAPYSSEHFNPDYTYAPPQQVHFIHDGDFGPYVYGYTFTENEETLELEFEVDKSRRIPIKLFAEGATYKFLGLFETDVHLFGPGKEDAPMYLLGADKNGHDLLSRVIHGTRISMSIGLIGVTMAFLLGVLLGGISGYFGGRVDTAIQRLVEFFMSVPTLPLWLGLAAALPAQWSAMQRYFAITVILSIIAWTDLARVTRGRFLSLREEQFVEAAKLDGSRQPRIIFGHMLPSFTSHLIASLTLSIPGMILAETALSYLGLGLQAPTVSWGVLLQEAQNIRTISTAPWLLIPGLGVVVAVLSLNFVGDGLRDAADPYRR